MLRTMRRQLGWLVTIGLTLAVPSLPGAETGHASAQVQDAAGTIRELERAQAAAVVSRDFATLERIYADDFRFVHGTGEVQSKAEWLERLRTGEARYRSREHETLEVELHDDIAVTYGSLLIDRHMQGVDSRFRARYVRVYRRRDGAWRLISHRTVEQTELG